MSNATTSTLDHGARRPRRRRSAAAAGFTLVEILIAVVIVVIGLVGLMAMQIVAIQANATARDVSEATTLAEHFVTSLQQDATHWTVASDLSQTTWLATAVASGNVDTWQVVTDSDDEMVSGLGVDRASLTTAEQGRARYCIAYRLRWAVANEALSGFVRVYWQRQGGERVLDDCGAGGSGELEVADLDTRSLGVQMVTLPLTVRRTHVE